MKQKQQIRACFRDAVFKRDKHKCVFCNATVNLDAHHITDRNLMPNGGYVKENGVTLCDLHHKLAEQFHITKGADWYANVHPIDLYKLIGSSYELAYKKSLQL